MITTCKECQVKVSDQAASCPNCGISFPGIKDEHVKAIDKDSKYRTWLYVPGILFFGSIGYIIIEMLANGDKAGVEAVYGYWPYTIAGVALYIAGEVIRNIKSKVND